MILNFFNGTPRPEQADALLALEDGWVKHDVHVVRAPPGFGKTKFAECVTKWVASFDHTVAYVPPDSVLQAQAQRECPDIPSLWGAKTYRCVMRPAKTCDKARKLKRHPCQAECPAIEARLAASHHMRLMHTYTYLGNHGKKKGKYPYPDVAIFDEAHKLINFMQEQRGVRLWRFKHHWPMDIATHEDAVSWIDGCSEALPGKAERLRARKLLLQRGINCVVRKQCTVYRGRSEWCLWVQPLSIRDEPPILWPPRVVEHVVLLSATIERWDIADLGLDKFRRVHYIDGESPIPPSSRPVVVQPYVDVSMKARTVGLSQVAEEIRYLADSHPEAGFIHATYEDAARLRGLLTNPRFMWHDHENKQSVYKNFISGVTGRDRIFVGSGFTEGVDLSGDLARWQVLTRVPTLDLSEPAIAMRAEQDPEWYDWQSVKGVIQASGRVRDGVTYIYDQRFKRLFDDRRYMFPQWYADSIRW